MSTTGATPSPPPPPPAPGPATGKRKGLSPLAWVAIGCGTLTLLATIVLVAAGMFVFDKGRELVESVGDDPAMAAAETAIRLNPELELVASDREADTLTVRNKRTGEEMTVDLAAFGEGKIRFESDGGETRFEIGSDAESGVVSVTRDGEETFRLGGGSAADLPEWLPVYPGTEATSLYSSRGGEGAQGAFTVATGDSAREVISWYREELERDGFEVEASEITGAADGGMAASLEARAGDGRKVGVMAIRAADETRLTVSYESRPR